MCNKLGQQIGEDEVMKIHDSFCHECLSQMTDEKKRFIRSVVDMVKSV
jgi:hypothetical protein